MKMKYYRLFFSGLVMFTLLYSCNKEEFTDYSPDDYILFSAPKMTVETESRSSFIDGEFTNDASFGVMGYCVPYKNLSTDPDWESGDVVWGAKMPNVHPDVFDEQKVTYNSADGTCSYDNGPKKWYNTSDNPDAINPDDYLYTFFAYYPYENFEVSTTNNSGKGAPIFKFKMPFKTTSGETSFDDNMTPDAMLAVNYNILRTSGNVTFNFSHIMVGLGFSIANYNYAESDVVTVSSIKIKGSFVRSLVVDFNKNTSDDDFYNYPTDERYQGYFDILSEPITVNPGDIEEPQKHLLLLSDIKGSYFGDVSLEITYTYDNKERTITGVPRPTDFKPQPGVKYTAQLSFVGETFVINFIASDNEIWEDGGDSNITIQ